MSTQTFTQSDQSESTILSIFDSLIECPECQLGRYALNLFRVNGQVMVACNICESARDYAEAHIPNP